MRAPRIKKEAVETRIRTEEARRVPGTQGDTLKVVQNLPGVGALVVRLGPADRLGLGAQGHARQRRRRRDPGALSRGRPALDGERRSGHVDRPVAGIVRRRVRPRAGRPGAHRARAAAARGRARLRRRRRDRRVGDAVRRRRPALAHRPSPGAISYLDRLLPVVTSTDVGDFVPDPALRRLPGARDAGDCARTRSWR